MGSEMCIRDRSLSLQIEANQLKGIAKMVALGIGSGASDYELVRIASLPLPDNVIRAQSFIRLPAVTEQLRNATCTGQ